LELVFWSAPFPDPTVLSKLETLVDLRNESPTVTGQTPAMLVELIFTPMLQTCEASDLMSAEVLLYRSEEHGGNIAIHSPTSRLPPALRSALSAPAQRLRFESQERVFAQRRRRMPPVEWSIDARTVIRPFSLLRPDLDS